MLAPTLFTEVFDRDLQLRLLNPHASYLLSMWELARAGAPAPEMARFAERVPAHCLGSLMILRRLDDGDFTYEHYGADIARAAGFDMTGRRVSEFNGALRGFYTGLYRRCLDEPRALGSLHRLGHFRERPMWERLMLPVADGGRPAVVYAINTVREIHNEATMLRPTLPGAGMIALQFARDANGVIASADIIGVNRRAQEMTGRRLDEMLHRPMAECFPGVMSTGLWERYLTVAARREPESFTQPYDQDNVAGVFAITVAPFHDGVTVEFRKVA